MRYNRNNFEHQNSYQHRDPRNDTFYRRKNNKYGNRSNICGSYGSTALFLRVLVIIRPDKTDQTGVHEMDVMHQ